MYYLKIKKLNSEHDGLLLLFKWRKKIKKKQKIKICIKENLKKL